MQNLKLSISVKQIIVDLISYALFLLFVYAALSKLFAYPLYISDLQRSPELGPYARFISIAIPAVELFASVLLLVGRLRLLGFYISFFLMCAFTIYVWYVLNYSEELPCSCGGIFRKMTWRSHLKVNELFTGLALLGIILEHFNRRHKDQNQRLSLAQT